MATWNLKPIQFVYMVLAATSLSGTLAFASDFEQIDTSKNVSQLIRSNSNHYWKFMRHEADLRRLKPYLAFQGVVAGDPHLGNFAPVPVAFPDGHRSIKFVDIDFDDAGRAPFVLDFARLMVATKAVAKGLKASDLTNAYVSGLRGEDREPPAIIQKALAIPLADYDAKADRYTAKKTDGDRFRYDSGDVIPYDGPVTRDQIQALFSKARVLDYAARVKERGGSAGSMRFWVLVSEVAQDKSRRRIYELKAHAQSGVSAYRDQMTPLAWLKDINTVFRKDLDPSGYSLVRLGQEGLFWLREKKVNLIDVDYNGKSAEEKAFAIELALYDGWYLGRLHGSQVSAKPYLTKIEADRPAFKDAVKAVAKAYLQRALSTFESGR